MTPYLTHIRIGDRTVGAGQPTYIIAEVGINHNGNPELARKLIEVGIRAGVDAVKFQKRHLASLYSPESLLDPGKEEKEIGYILPYIMQAELSDEALSDLAAYSRVRGMEFICTPWDATSVDLLEQIGVAAYKVSSPDLTNLPLLEYMCRTGRPLVLSTGMSRLGEIAATVEFLKSKRVEFALLHCQSTYPAPFKDVNLRFMERLREFGVPVGYSGHERGIAVSTAAAALGACIVERHITLDRSLPGPDQADSLEPAGIEKQVRDIRNVEMALGSRERGLSRGELLNRLALGKSLVAARDVAVGETISADAVKVMGPGHGVSPQQRDALVGRTAVRAITAGEQYRESDLAGQSLASLAASFPLPWGPVVRYRDYEAMAAFCPQLFEFHLTDKDLDGPVPDLAPCSQELVIHAPEYYHGRLLDLASSDGDVVRRSVEVLEHVCEVARSLRRGFGGTPERVRIVVHPGAMTYDPAPLEGPGMVERLCQVLPSLQRQAGVELLIENMPPYPWYFGGQWHHNAFMSSADLLAVHAATGVRLCLDISHGALYATAAHVPLRELVESLMPTVSHIHMADASGTDGEGLQIGDGDVDFAEIMPAVVASGASVVPEIWLGHRNDGEGFVVALHRLSRIMEESRTTP
jgi:sialic acid synthase SpsE/sugar phosphate isomerase/epimerase